MICQMLTLAEADERCTETVHSLYKVDISKSKVKTNSFYHKDTYFEGIHFLRNFKISLIEKTRVSELLFSSVRILNVYVRKEIRLIGSG